MRSAPDRFDASTAGRPTAPSPTTPTVSPAAPLRSPPRGGRSTSRLTAQGATSASHRRGPSPAPAPAPACCPRAELVADRTHSMVRLAPVVAEVRAADARQHDRPTTSVGCWMTGSGSCPTAMSVGPKKIAARMGLPSLGLSPTRRRASKNTPAGTDRPDSSDSPSGGSLRTQSAYLLWSATDGDELQAGCLPVGRLRTSPLVHQPDVVIRVMPDDPGSPDLDTASPDP
jgi:hypothetical protein